MKNEVKIDQKKIFEVEDYYSKLNQKTDFSHKLTDHSLIRYLQRIELIPISQARYKILSQIDEFMNSYKPNLKILRGNTFELKLEEVIYVIRNKTVITVKKII
jgi:hypothetical protein